MKLVFRADASQALGSGHVMRCLSLADQLKARGATTVFVSLDLPEHLEQHLREAGHEVHRLPADVRGDEVLDAEATVTHAKDADRVILDSYALSTPWELHVGREAPVLAVDDLGRPHVAQWVLDQNYYADPQARYEGLLGSQTTALFGPQYALLREEFAKARRHARVRDQGVRNVVVFMGGMDTNNATSVALEAIDLGLPADVRVAVVAGASHPSLASLREWCSNRACAQLHVQVNEMASLLLAADLAVGAGGSSTWERCAVGLPAITLCLAENQREVVREGALAGFLWGVDRVPTPRMLGDILRVLHAAPEVLSGVSRRALDVTDARGAQRVADILMPRKVQVRPAGLADARLIYDWRTAPHVRATSRNSEPFTFDAHCEWLKRALLDPRRLLLVGTSEGVEIGVVRFDMNESRAEVSIFLAPERIGAGLGGPLLLEAETKLRTLHPEIRWVDAWINEGNRASTDMFTRLGYQTRICRLDKEICLYAIEQQF